MSFQLSWGSWPWKMSVTRSSVNMLTFIMVTTLNATSCKVPKTVLTLQSWPWLGDQQARQPNGDKYSLFSARIACWYEHWTRNRKVKSSNPSRSGGWIVFSRVNLVCWPLFEIRSTPGLLQWHVKDPGHSAKSTGGRLHLNTHTPLTQRSQCGLTTPLSRLCVGTNPETSSHATC